MARKRKARTNGSNYKAQAPLATVAALDSQSFSSINSTDPIPKTWKERAVKAWNYYLEEPLVKHCINAWRVFAIGEEIKIAADDEDLKVEARELANRLGVSSFVKDMILQLLVKGDAVAAKQIDDDANTIAELVCINPTSIKITVDDAGRLTRMVQSASQETGGDDLELPLDRVLHLKWDAPQFSPRGNSMVLPAFDSIEQLRDYRRAEKAIAKRWATPFRLIKVGGTFGQKTIMPDQKMLETVRDLVNRMDMKSGLVTPFYVNVETHGTDGQVLNTEGKVREVKEDIMIALGLSRSLVTGDGPNFATASVSLQKMLVMIREIKKAARDILAWVFDDWRKRRGWDDKAVQFIFNDLDPTDAADYKKLMLDLYDRGLISRNTMHLKMDLDPDIEAANLETEGEGLGKATDGRLVGVIKDLTLAGIIEIDDARQLLKIQRANKAPQAKADLVDRCGSCIFLDEGGTYCDLLGQDRKGSDLKCEDYEQRYEDR